MDPRRRDPARAGPRRDPRPAGERAAAIRASALSGQVVAARDRRLAAIADARAFGDVRLLARIIAAFDVPTLWTSREYGSLDATVVDATDEALDRLPGAERELRVRLLTTLAMELEGSSTTGASGRPARRCARPAPWATPS